MAVRFDRAGEANGSASNEVFGEPPGPTSLRAGRGGARPPLPTAEARLDRLVWTQPQASFLSIAGSKPRRDLTQNVVQSLHQPRHFAGGPFELTLCGRVASLDG